FLENTLAAALLERGLEHLGEVLFFGELLLGIHVHVTTDSLRVLLRNSPLVQIRQNAATGSDGGGPISHRGDAGNLGTGYPLRNAHPSQAIPGCQATPGGSKPALSCLPTHRPTERF